MRRAVAPPQDQAAGLRRMFVQARPRFVPVLANSHLPSANAMLERVSAACAELELTSLVVDSGAPPRELARLDLAAGIEPLSRETAYLAARGLALGHVDAEGSTERFLDALADAAPAADVVFVHAGASELARLFARRAARVLLLAGDAPRSVTQAYAGLKLLALRARLLSHDLLLAGTPGSARAERIATQFARCADDFVGALLHSFACIDPAATASNPALRRFVRELLLANAPGAAPQAPEDRWHEPAAAWAA